MGLRTRLVFMVVGLVTTVVVGISSYFIVRHQNVLEREMVAKIEAMRDDLRRKGRLIARNVAQSSVRAIVVSDFLFLKEIVDGVSQNDKEFTYGIIMADDRRALVHTDPSKMLTELDGPSDRFAAQQKSAAEQEVVISSVPHLEIIEPIGTDTERLGVIRFGLSLANLNRAIEDQERKIHADMKSDILTTITAAIVLIIIASLLGTMVSTRLVRPLHQLLSGVRGIAAGELHSEVSADVGGGPEISNLVQAFNKMTQAVRERDEALRKNMAELAEALAQAKEASRLKSEFVANVSHELRTPLNAIINIPASLVKDCDPVSLWVCRNCKGEFLPDTEYVGTSDGPIVELCPDCSIPLKLEERRLPLEHDKFKQFLNILLSSGKHLLQVVNDILDFSKLEAGKLKLFLEEVDVGELLEKVSVTLDPLSRDKDLKMVYQQPDKPIHMTADSVKLMQIFINLVGNAIKFTPRSGEIRVHVEGPLPGPTPMIRFSVVDSGIGIPADKIAGLFESFRQVDGGHTRKYGGTGLGLSITKKLIELHGGSIQIKSMVGHGSTFEFILPVDCSPKKQPEDAKAPSPDVARERTCILVVDDDPVQLQLTGMVLKREGYDMVAIGDPSACIAAIEEHRPSVVVLDVMMPAISGLDILRQIKGDARTADLPVIVSTAYHANEDIARQLGGIWMPKPWSSQDFIQRVQDAVGQPSVSPK